VGDTQNNGAGVESSIWTLSGNQLSAQWINSDGTEPTNYLVSLNAFSTQHYYLSGDVSAFESVFGSYASGYIGQISLTFTQTGTQICPTVAGFSEDPHFVGLQGEKYNILGENLKWFSIITAADFQFNALFQNACEDKTHMTAITSIAMNFQGHHFMINSTGLAQLDGVKLLPSPRKTPYLIGEKGSYGKIVHPWDNYFEIETPEFSLVVVRKIVDHAIQQPGWVYYGKNCLDGYFNTKFMDHNISTPLHGLLGQTASHVHTGAELATPKGNEGQGEIEGTYRDYEVSGPFANDFKFNLYSGAL